MFGIESASLTKERIISIIQTKGPSLPVQIAKALNISPLFASAFLSELYGERKIKISNMKVGSSPLYYFPGQEHLLENFVDYLNSKEKEALFLLKQEKILEDELQNPAIRVALRSLKDFAIQIKKNVNGTEKNLWKYFRLPDSEISSLISKDNIEIKIGNDLEENLAKKEKEEIVKNEEETKQGRDKGKEETKERKRQRKGKSEEKSDFSKFLESYLKSKGIEIIESLSEKKKESVFKIRTNSQFGEQEYLLIAKNKKKITEDEITIALQKAREERMIALIMAPGEIEKKAKDYIKTWQNLIKFEKIPPLK